MKNVISVDTIAELFWDGYEHQECDDSCPVAGKYNQAVKDLHSLLISKLPEKRKDTRGNTQNPDNSKYLTKTAIGYNSAISDMYSTLNELFGVSNE